jgi:hypothetical protein
MATAVTAATQSSMTHQVQLLSVMMQRLTDEDQQLLHHALHRHWCQWYETTLLQACFDAYQPLGRTIYVQYQSCDVVSYADLTPHQRHQMQQLSPQTLTRLFDLYPDLYEESWREYVEEYVEQEVSRIVDQRSHRFGLSTTSIAALQGGVARFMAAAGQLSHSRLGHTTSSKPPMMGHTTPSIMRRVVRH